MLKECEIVGRGWVGWRLSAASVCLAASSCGAPPAPAAPVTPVVSAAPISKEEAPDLSAVTAPPELVAVLRFKKPQTAIETAAAWANFPLKLQDVLPPALHGLESVVAWDAPLEAAVALDPTGEGKVPEPLAVVSVGLSSLEGALDFARSKGESVRRLRPGVYRVGDSDDVSCEAGVAVGSAPARLVCGHRARDVDGLFNYATRGLPNEPLAGVDFQLELRLEPVKKRYQAELGSARLLAGFLLREVQLDNPRFDRALADTAYALVDEATALIHDLDKVRIDANLDAAKNMADVRFDLKFAAQKSWLVQSSVETASMLAEAPDLFWQMPADSTAASFSIGWKPGRLKPIGRTLADLVDGYLEYEKVPAGVRDRAAKTVEALFDQNTKQVRAQGELATLPSDPLLAADYRMFGWQIAAIDGEPKGLLALFDGLAATLQSRDIARVLQQRLDIDPRSRPVLSSHAVQLRGFKPGAKAYRLDVPRELFEKLAQSQLAVLPEAAKGKAVQKTAPISFIIAADAEHSWIALSPDEKSAIKRLESLKVASTPVLRTRAGLEALQGAPHAAAGFFTLARFGGQFEAFSGRDAARDSLINSLPHHGETPIAFTYDLNLSGPELTTSLRVPRAVFEDAGALVPILALSANRRGLGLP